jgi:hypothetical protein
MHDSLHHLRMLAEGRFARRYELEEIEQTLAELEQYLETNPEDEIAMIQFAQYVRKREAAAARTAAEPERPVDTELQA